MISEKKLLGISTSTINLALNGLMVVIGFMALVMFIATVEYWFTP